MWVVLVQSSSVFSFLVDDLLLCLPWLPGITNTGLYLLTQSLGKQGLLDRSIADTVQSVACGGWSDSESSSTFLLFF